MAMRFKVAPCFLMPKNEAVCVQMGHVKDCDDLFPLAKQSTHWFKSQV